MFHCPRHAKIYHHCVLDPQRLRTHLDEEDEQHEGHVAKVDDEDEATDHGHRTVCPHSELSVPLSLYEQRCT